MLLGRVSYAVFQDVAGVGDGIFVERLKGSRLAAPLQEHPEVPAVDFDDIRMALGIDTDVEAEVDKLRVAPLECLGHEDGDVGNFVDDPRGF